jgi:hypothetical protein
VCEFLCESKLARKVIQAAGKKAPEVDIDGSMTDVFFQVISDLVQ